MSVLSPLSSFCSDDIEPSAWMLERIFVFDLNRILNPQQCKDLQNAICGLDFIYDHIGGHGTNSPQRGVAVVGDRLLSPSSEPIKYTHWTASQNASQLTATTQTEPLPDGVIPVINPLIGLTRQYFPDAPISSATYALGVANEYRTGYKDNISPHTDAQPWYASPPVFASITYYPDGQPEIPEACYRFKIYDDSTKKWRFVHLPHNSLCLMRADVTHKVLAPFAKYKNMFKRRINMTLRNLVSKETNPLGFAMALANHYRYYGKPIQVKLPNDSPVEKHLPLLQRYLKLSEQVGTGDKFKIVRSNLTSIQRRDLHSRLRQTLRQLYQKNDFNESDIQHVLGKSNVVLETTQRAIEWSGGIDLIASSDDTNYPISIDSISPCSPSPSKPQSRTLRSGDGVIVKYPGAPDRVFVVTSVSNDKIIVSPQNDSTSVSWIIPHEGKWVFYGGEGLKFTFDFFQQ